MEDDARLVTATRAVNFDRNQKSSIAWRLPHNRASHYPRRNKGDEQVNEIQPSERFAGQTIAQTERMKELAASGGSESPTLIYVTEEERKILQALKSEYPELLTQAKIVKLIGLDVGRRTIQKRLPILRDVKKLVVQPDGPKSGYGLSDVGWKAVTAGM